MSSLSRNKTNSYKSATKNRTSSDASGEEMALPRIPKKKKYAVAAEPVATAVITDPINNSNSMGEASKIGEDPTTAPKQPETAIRKSDGPPKHKVAKDVVSTLKKSSSEGFDPPILRKGDLVRISNEQRSGRIQGGLARIARSNFSADDPEGDPISYDIEYVLGGKVSNLERSDLDYTTATAEGLIDASDNSGGHFTRRRRATRKSETQEEQEEDLSKGKKNPGPKRAKSAADEGYDSPPPKRKPGRPPSKNSVRAKKEAAAAAAEENKKRKRGSKTSDTESIELSAKEIRSQAAKIGWEKRRQHKEAAAAEKEASKSSGKPGRKPDNKAKAAKESKRGVGRPKAAKESKRGSKRNSATDASESDATSTAAQTDNSQSRRMEMYTRHRREMEKSLHRLEKVDRFGFFLDNTPAEFDENYDNGEEDEEGGEADDGLEQKTAVTRKSVQSPDQPPFNFLVIRKRFAAGRYDINMAALEQQRLREIKAMVANISSDSTTSTSKNDERMEAVAIKEVDANDEEHQQKCSEVDYDKIAKSMVQPFAVDWETFNADVISMCDAAMARDPDGVELGSGHLGWAANKVKKSMEEMYVIYGEKRMMEVIEDEARAKYDKVLMSCGNMEAAMQGKWRKEAFPERKYERLEKSSVICDGLSPKDRSYAMYELETKLPDSFLGLAYTYDDSGQHSETWMKTVADETTKPKKSRAKKKNKDGDESETATKEENKAQKAAMALAKDDGVIRAQVQTAMTTLLIQVQDKVMTDLGVMHAPEARSANWDDGDRGRDYRGGEAEVEQGTHSNFSLPEVAEQEVWGMDCYTRKNVMALIESEFTSEIAIEFVEKWLLPAINACPVDLAHKMSTATRILEGLPPVPPPTTVMDRRKLAASDRANSSVEDLANEATEDAIIPSYQQATQAQPSEADQMQESSVFLRNAIESKVKEHGPPWLKAAARMVRLAADSMDNDFFRIHPKGHGSVVIGGEGLKANSLVTYYRGEVYPAWRWCEKLDAIEHVQKELDLRPNLPDFYNMAMERPKKDPRGYCLLFVDASRKSGLGSSFSHSCNPSCEVRVVSLNGKLSLSMTTLRDLEQGEELTFDYNAVTESFNEYRFAVCLCGQRKCRGSFLHFATADCYQQVLSRNSPISARFANLVRGCMKQVMSKEDSELLLKHGFNTAAFGAVSFNHHVSRGDPNSSPDSIENVPIWLRTFVADCLRYIEYERRALPVALLCNQMERMDPKKAKRKTKSKKEKLAPVIEAPPEKSKAIAGSKPKTSYFFFLQSQRAHYERIAREENEEELAGLVLSQAINKVASRDWNNLREEEKQEWKKKSIADWKKNGGIQKAKMEEERQSALKKAAKAPAKQKAEVATDEEETEEESNSLANNDIGFETKTISFADADAEGFSAMEQRIQQLAQSLSRVGRVLDRHRESVFDETNDQNVTADSDLLRKFIPSPLKIMSDDEVVNWMWSGSKGAVPNLFTMINQHFPEKSLLREILLSTKECYPVLEAFSNNFSVPSLEKKWKHSCTSSDARRLVREALLKFRENIIDFLSFAEKSHAEARNEKRREQARAREEKKKQQQQQQQETETSEMDQPGQDEIKSEVGTGQEVNLGPVKNDVVEDTDDDTDDDSDDDQSSDGHDASADEKRSLEDEVMPMRGGGDGCTSTELNNGLFGSQMLGQDSTLKPASIEPSNTTSAHEILLPPTGIRAPHEQQPQTGQEVGVHSSVSDDVASLLQLSKVANNFHTAIPENQASGLEKTAPEEQIDKIIPEEPVSGMNNSQSGYDEKIESKPSTESTPSKLEFLLDVATSSSISKNAPILPLSSPLPGGDQNPASPSCETKKAKKKVIPLTDDQVKYLKDWLYDPKHILNPYPTDDEKSVMMKDIGVERKRLDGWFMKNRQKVLYPESKPVKMKWRKHDQDHWDDFRTNRYMLEATADLLLMYASTNTFFLLEPFRQFDSTPIEVYARELGNEVPRHFAFNSQKDPVDSEGDALVQQPAENTAIVDENIKTILKNNKAKKEEGSEKLCSPDDVVDKVAVDYSGEYVLSQLLQWVNGGIGQKKGLPDIYGCVMLPPIPGCWDEVKSNEVKLPNYTKWNRKTTTEYDAHIRPKLAEWIVDRYRRGSPWEEEVAKYYCPSNPAYPDPTLPMGSPIIDYLVTGIDDNIRSCASTLSGKANATGQGKSKMSATDRLQSTVDEGMPAQAVANWVQCENPKCLKWRKLPWHVDVDLLPEKFFCKDNVWNKKCQTCDAPEDEWDMDDAPIKFDICTKDDMFEVAAWFDVQREGKVGYHEAQVVEMDLKSNVKRVKFHFWKLSSDRDEWIEVGSPRIAPHHSYTPRPRDGYKDPKVKEKKSSDKTKGTKKQPSADGNAPTLPQKRKKDEVIPSSTSEQAEGTNSESKKITLPFPPSTIDYMNKWMTDHAKNPFPTPEEKAQIIAITGLSKRQVGDWMARSRKKLRKIHPENKSLPVANVLSAPKPTTDVTAVGNVMSSPTRVENLLLELKNGGNMPAVVQSSAVQSAVNVGQVNPLAQPGSEKKTSIKELEAFMQTWLARPENGGNLMPTLEQKEQICQETGIEKKRLEGWFFRARKKAKKQQEQKPSATYSMPPVGISASTLVAPSAAMAASSATTFAPTAPHQQPSQKQSETYAVPPTGFSVSPMMARNPPVTLSGLANAPSVQMKTGSVPGTLTTAAIMACQHATASVVKSHAPSTPLNSGLPSHPTPNAKPPSATPSSPQNKGLTEEAKSQLERWLLEHKSHPYPNRDEKDEMMKRLGLTDARKLEGWFCRARKRLKRDELSYQVETKSAAKNPQQHPQQHNPKQQTPQQPVSQPAKSSSQMDSSPFAYLLSAAEIHESRQSASKQPAAREYAQEKPPPYGSQHGFSPSRALAPPRPPAGRSERQLGPREQAILSSFQSLQSVEIHDRASRRPSPAEYPAYQQQSAPTEYVPPDSSSYNHSPGQHGNGEYSTYHHYDAPPADYSSHQYSHGNQGGHHAEYYSNYQHQGHEYNYPPQHNQASSNESQHQSDEYNQGHSPYGHHHDNQH